MVNNGEPLLIWSFPKMKKTHSWNLMEHPTTKWMIWGYPYFRQPPYVFIVNHPIFLQYSNLSHTHPGWTERDTWIDHQNGRLHQQQKDIEISSNVNVAFNVKQPPNIVPYIYNDIYI